MLIGTLFAAPSYKCDITTGPKNRFFTLADIFADERNHLH